MSGKKFYLFDTSLQRFITLFDGICIGRTDGAVQYPDDEDLSPVHLRLFCNEREVRIEDLGSVSSGRVSINNWPIDRGNPRALRVGDTISVGKQRFILSTQNLYRPVPVISAVDRTQVGLADPTVVLPENSGKARPRFTPVPPPDSDSPAASPPSASTSSATIEPPTIALSTDATFPTLSFTEDEISTQLVRFPRPEKRVPGARLPRVGNRALALPLSLIAAVGTVFLLRTPEPVVIPAKTPSRVSRNPAGSTPPSRSTLQKPNGIPLADGRESYWEALGCDEAPLEVLFLKNFASRSQKSPAQILASSGALLKRFLALPQNGWNLPLGDLPGMESMADSACRIALEEKAPLPRTTPEKFLKDLFQAQPDEASAGASASLLPQEVLEAQAGPAPAVYYSARLATIQHPLSSDGKIELTSAVIDCRDPAGRRFALSQHKATLFHVIQARAALSAQVLSYEARLKGGIKENLAREAIRRTQLATLIKGNRNLIVQIEAFKAWLQSPSAPLSLEEDTRTQFMGTANSFSDSLANESDELMRSYEQKRVVYPSLYPALQKDALLDEQELLFLSAT